MRYAFKPVFLLFLIFVGQLASADILIGMKEEYRDQLHLIEKKIELMGGKIARRFHKVFAGVHVLNVSPDLLYYLKSRLEVEFIEGNQKGTIAGGIPKASLESNVELNKQLDRLDQRALPLDDSFVAPSYGEGAHVYVTSTGINSSHEAFGGRVTGGHSVFPDQNPLEDCFVGIGSWLAGWVGGGIARDKIIGVAEKVSLHPINDFDCLARNSKLADSVAGIEWLLGNFEAPAIYLASLSFVESEALTLGFERLLQAGVSVVMPSSNGDNCTSSGVALPGLILVEPSVRNDVVHGNDTGNCHDVYAYGGGATVSQTGAAYSTVSTGSGLVSAPYVAGVLAVLRGAYPSLSPLEAEQILVESATQGVLQNLPEGMPDRLLNIDVVHAPKVVTDDDKLLRQPVSEVTIWGTITDNAKVARFSWKQTSGSQVFHSQSSSVALSELRTGLTLKNLDAGQYEFQLTAMDDEGFINASKTKIEVTEGNLAPILRVQFGDEMNLGDPLIFNGSSSYDRDGSIASVLYEQIEGPTDTEILNPNELVTEVRGFINGRYIFFVTITDNEGLSSSRQLGVVINHPPIVNAGLDQETKLPTDSLTLSGEASDPDSGIVEILWSQKSGPSVATISTPNQARTDILGLQEGVYVFELYAKDDHNAEANDQVTVHVFPENFPPEITVPLEVRVQLPNEVEIEAKCSDRDGVCSELGWEFIDGPNSPTIKTRQALHSSTLIAGGLITGVYDFKTFAKDDKGREAVSNVSIIVIP